MNKLRYAFQVFYYDWKCRLLKGLRWGQRWWSPQASGSSYLFVLCPPYGGSTLVQELLSTSASVSPNNIFGTREGQGLPEARQLFDYQRLWDPSYELPWEQMRQVWHQYWELSKPILLDKSPSNLLRAASIEQAFLPAYFVVVTRHPLAHCESLIRRDGKTAREAAQFCLDCLKAQRKNLENCQRALWLSYEALVQFPEKAVQDLVQFLPQLEAPDIQRQFKAHNYLGRALPITDLNQEKIDRLSRGQIQEIKEVFETELDILSYFGYSF
ncbi:MAG: sulfotransferase [Bacteroidota bacterium]